MVDELIENPEMLSMGGKKVWISVFFSDIRGFTTMSEKMEPEEIVAEVLEKWLSDQGY